jgi:hypothetical protein
MTSINFLRVLTLGYDPQDSFQSNEYKPNMLIQVCITLIGMIKILKF